MIAAQIAKKLGGHPIGDGWLAKCPAHDDQRPSLSINERNGKPLVKCHAGCDQSAVISALEQRGLWQRRERESEPPVRHPKLGVPSVAYDYHDASGHCVMRVMRFDTTKGKTFSQASRQGEAWILKAMPAPRPIYRLPNILRNRTVRVLICEGEKAAEAAQELFPDLAVTTWAGGAHAVSKTDWATLASRDVTLWPDADAAGMKAMDALAAILTRHGCIVRRVDVKQFGKIEKGWDAADAGDAVASGNLHMDVAWRAVMEAEPLAAPAPTADQPRDEAAQPSAVGTVPRIDDTDLANGRRMARRHGNTIRFTTESGWYVWDGARWLHDPKAVRVQSLAKDTATAIFDEIGGAPNQDAMFRHAKRSQSKPGIEAMIFMARSEPGVLVTLDQFDADPWLLNVANGTLDLRTCTLRPHRREDLITKLAPAHFDARGQCPAWTGFLERVTDANHELCDYLQRMIGYMLTGTTTEQVLHFLYGLGANGKSVFCEVLHALLGEYAMIASPEMVMAKKHSSIPNDIARLRGVRLALMNETSQGARFDEAKLKDLTGSDTLTGRFLHQEFFDFAPTHKLVIRGNHKPTISGTDDGIWRRLRLVPFTVQIPPEERDPNLLNKLRAELPGILRWAVDGCRAWQANGLAAPSCIQEAVREYRTESDTLGRFIEEQCEVRPLAQVKSSVLYQRYRQFAEMAGERAIPSKDLPHEMQRRGVEWKRTKHGGLYLGIELCGTAETRWEAAGDGW